MLGITVLVLFLITVAAWTMAVMSGAVGAMIIAGAWTVAVVAFLVILYQKL